MTASEQTRGAGAGSRGRILLVDDEPAILRAYKRTMTLEGFNITTATNAAEAISRIATEDYDLVLSDIGMPEMDGLQLLRTVRSHDSDLPVVLITGAPTIESAVEAVEFGALRYLIKPVESEKLLETVGFAVNMRRLAQAKREAAIYLRDSTHGNQDQGGLEERFGRAMERLWIAYQPIVSWKGQRVAAYEALVRSEEESLRHPGALFDAAERLGRVFDLGRAIRRNIALGVALVPNHCRVFVNLHPEDLLDDRLYSESAPLSKLAGRVVLELTERMSLAKVPGLQERLVGLRSLGFELAVDDLGAGYSGLSAFASIQPEVAKIDMSLVRAIDRDPTRLRLVKAMTDVCAEMGVTVVCEGIETPGEREAVVGIGCDLLQGFLFGKPERRPSPAVL